MTVLEPTVLVARQSGSAEVATVPVGCRAPSWPAETDAAAIPDTEQDEWERTASEVAGLEAVAFGSAAFGASAWAASTELGSALEHSASDSPG